MLKELMLPAEVKLLKPNPAGCWHCVAAMMHGLLVLCGPRVFPCIGPVSVSDTAEAEPVSANIAAAAPTVIHVSRPFMSSLLSRFSIASNLGDIFRVDGSA